MAKLRFVNFSSSSILMTIEGVGADFEKMIGLEECLRDIFARLQASWRLKFIASERIIVMKGEATVSYRFMGGFPVVLGMLHLARSFGVFHTHGPLASAFQTVVKKYYSAKLELVQSGYHAEIEWYEMSSIAVLIACGRLGADDLPHWEDAVMVDTLAFREIFFGKASAGKTN